MLQDLTPPAPRNQCKTCKVLESLEPSDRQILETALADREKWAVRTLSRELANRGIKLSETTIINHREGNHA